MRDRERGRGEGRRGERGRIIVVLYCTHICITYSRQEDRTGEVRWESVSSKLLQFGFLGVGVQWARS